MINNYYSQILSISIIVFILTIFEILALTLIIFPRNLKKIDELENRMIDKLLKKKKKKVRTYLTPFETKILNNLLYIPKEIESFYRNQINNKFIYYNFSIIIIITIIFIFISFYLLRTYQLKNKIVRFFKTIDKNIIYNIILTILLIVIFQIYFMFIIIPKIQFEGENIILNYISENIQN